jgi:hypothetical protein
MNEMLLLAVLVLNVLISIWNCYAVGTAWKDTMSIGGVFNKLVLWSAVIQSGIGFSMPILIGLTYVSVSYLTSGTDPSLTAEEGRQMIQWIFSLWYVAVIFPILGSGMAIWAHSLRVAYQRRDFSSIAAAGWNSYAQIHNMVSAAHNLGGALGNVGELFAAAMKGKSNGKGKVAILVLMLVAISLAGGFMIAFGLVRYFASRAESRVEQYARHEFA